MKGVRLIAVIGALAASAAAGAVAHADPITTDPAKPSFADRNQWAPQTVRKSFEWDAAKSRWGLKLDVDQQPVLGSDWKNVQAGAYFKLTPSLRVGAGVSLTDQLPTTVNAATQVPPPPRVHLETAFKF